MGEFSDYVSPKKKPAGQAAAPEPEGGEFAAYGEPAAADVPGLGGPARLRPPGPRQLTDEEAGTMSGPISTPMTRIGPVAILPGKSFAQAREEMAPVERPMADESLKNAAFMASMIPAGAGGALAGRAAGAATGEVLGPTIGRALGPVVGRAVEGGTANKIMGGDFTVGALLGAAAPAADLGIDMVAKGAPARVARRSLQNLTEDVTQKKADKVTQKAGPEGKALLEVVDRNPELKKALAVHAKDKPAVALKAVKATKDAANALRNADFDRMQKYYEDKPASAQASIPQVLDEFDRLLEKSPADLDRHAILSRARDEVAKLGDRLRKAQKLPPAVEGDYSGTVLSPHDLRDLEQTIGRRAYEQGTPTSVKRKLNGELYGPIARQVDALAKNTPGVDAKKFSFTGKDISTLIPVEEALQYKVTRAEQGKKPFSEKLMNIGHASASTIGALTGGAAHGASGAIIGLALPSVARGAVRLGERYGRDLDYRLSQTEALNPPVPAMFKRPMFAAPGLTVQGARDDRKYARRVTDALQNGMSLHDAMNLADDDEDK